MSAEAGRAPDEAGIEPPPQDPPEPSLDDVFAEATGHRLEGAGEAGPKTEDDAAPKPEKGRRKRR